MSTSAVASPRVGVSRPATLRTVALALAVIIAIAVSFAVGRATLSTHHAAPIRTAPLVITGAGAFGSPACPPHAPC